MSLRNDQLQTSINIRYFDSNVTEFVWTCFSENTSLFLEV